MAGDENDPEFVKFWGLYPRRVGKLAALRAWVVARKRASAEAIEQGLQRSARHWNERRFIPHPATWLRQGRWMDDEDESATDDPITPHERERAITYLRAMGSCTHAPRCPDSSACLARVVRGWRARERGR